MNDEEKITAPSLLIGF